MLVLTRQTNEKVIIRNEEDGSIIEVMVTRVYPDKEKCGIGFTAPPHYTIFREELAGGETKRNRRRNF